MVLADTTSATCSRIYSQDVVLAATAALTMRQSSLAFVLCSRTETRLWVKECSTGYQ